MANENKEEEINYVLSGTGCKNLFELKIAFDAMRNYMSCKYQDFWDEKKIANMVCRTMYNQCLTDCTTTCTCCEGNIKKEQ